MQQSQSHLLSVPFLDCSTLEDRCALFFYAHKNRKARNRLFPNHFPLKAPLEDPLHILCKSSGTLHAASLVQQL